MTILHTRYFSMPVMGLLLALAVFAAAPAKAEGRCPPGQFPVGGGNAGWEGCAPMDQTGGGPSQGPAPVQMVWVDNHYALAGHPDASNAWVAIGYPNGEAAKQAAISACAADMGQPCNPMGNSFNNSYVVGIGKEGGIYTDWDSTLAKARKNLTNACTKNNDVCFELRYGTARPGRKVAGSSFHDTPEILRPKGDFRQVYAAAAWVDPASPVAPLDVWIASGHRNPQDAARAAVGACARDTSSKCVIARRPIGDTFIVISLINDVTLEVDASPTAELAKSIMDRRCKKGTKCRLTGVFDARQGGVVRHQANKAPQK